MGAGMGLGFGGLFGTFTETGTSGTAASGGEGASPAEPLDSAVTSMLAMARMLNFRQQQASWARSQPQSYDPLRKTFRGGFYGDSFPQGRKRRSVDESQSSSAEVSHVRHKRANGEEEKKGFDFGFPNFLFSDRTAAAPVIPPLFFPKFLFAPSRRQRVFFSPPAGANDVHQPYTRQLFYSPARALPSYSALPARQQRLYGSPYLGNAPSYRQAPAFRTAPIYPEALATVQLQAPTPVTKPVANLPPVAGNTPVILPQKADLPSFAGQVPVTVPKADPPPAAGQTPVTQPVAGPAVVTLPKAAPPPVTSYAPVTLSRAATPQMTNPAPTYDFAATTYPKVPAPSGTIFGDTLPAYGKTTKAHDAAVKRVKRGSEDSSSSDPSPTEVVKLGDMSIPTDTFNKMISPRERQTEEYTPRARPVLPPPRSPLRVYYPPPQPYNLPGSYYHLHVPARRGNFILSRTGYLARQRNQLAAVRQIVNVLRQAGYVPTRRAVQALLRAGYSATRPAVYVPAGPVRAPLPMGAAQPVIHGTHPPY